MTRHDVSKGKAFFTLEAIMESISDAVIAIDVGKRVQWLNRAAERMSGLSCAEAVDRPCSAVLRSTMCGDSCALQRSLKTGKPIIDAPALFSSGGKHISVSICLGLMRDAAGNIVGAVETVRELSGIAKQDEESAEELVVPQLITQSPLMQKVLDQLPAIAASRSTALIFGETGTGKELVARTIHTLSRRQDPFFALNCGAFPDTLLESELFGYKKGSFTGADTDKAGCFALAKGGTLFLDDVEVMSLAMQAKLLRALQERSYRPLGAIRSETINARIIAATNEDLLDMVRKGTFRVDLFYRVNVVPLELPPLRNRKEDIQPLTEQMIESFNRSHGKSIQGLERDALTLLSAYDWPGNVRELQNVIERSFLLIKEGLIGIEHLPREIINAEGPARKCETDFLSEAETIRAALERNAFNRLAAARELGIHKATLYRRMKREGISLPKRKDAHRRRE